MRALFWLLPTTMLAGCATLGELGNLRNLVQPPRFEQADGRPAEIRLSQPSRDQPLGAASVRVWTSVMNPNPFGFTISRLDTTLMLEGRRAATSDFPLGLSLGARQQTVIPLDLILDFIDIPGSRPSSDAPRAASRSATSSRDDRDRRRSARATDLRAVDARARRTGGPVFTSRVPRPI